jgi:chaperonin cofactor prefoldin
MGHATGSMSSTRRMARFAQQVSNFKFFVKSDEKSGMTITNELTVWYSDQLEKFYLQSAKLDNWIRELYALQLSLEMMVNTWNVKIATKLSMITALEGTNSKLDITIRQLQTQIVGHKTKLKELTQTIEKKMKTINEMDRSKQETIDKHMIII